MLTARARAGLTQDVVAERMGTTKSAISRLESAGRHTPSLATLKRYASAVGCELQVKLVPNKSARQTTGYSRGRLRRRCIPALALIWHD
ncbi:MAG: helix-turn-helix domain-containing protein [Ramlibacter sp.]|nr:helix-turn-helix domain-containing protein [Ramlibacter sp.]